MTRFWKTQCKIALCLKTACCRVYLRENYQRQSCRVFSCLSIRAKMISDVSFYVKIWRILTHPFAKTQIFNIVASAVTPSKTSSINTDRKSTMRFQFTSVRHLAVAKSPCDSSYSIFARSASLHQP